MSLKKISIEINPQLSGLRVDKALSFHPDLGTRSRVHFLIEQGLVTISGRKVKASEKVSAGEVYTVQWAESPDHNLQKLDIALDILFEDKDLIVVNKPSGLVVHPAAGHQQDTLVNALLHHTQDLSMKFGDDRPGIVHRLDKETSGTLVVAKNDFAHEHLSKQFQNRTTHRVYWALCLGTARKENFKFQSYIARHPVHRQKMASVRDSKNQIISHLQDKPTLGKWAVTEAWPLLSKHQMTSFKIKLQTGRTHQIRVHFSEAGFPLAGDSVYGAEAKQKTLPGELQKEIKKFDRFFLHAAELGFVHPSTNENLIFKTDWPKDLKEFLNNKGFHFEFSKI
jgi:23S rRNA pseudouridine1911/1915/1917 synthase